ncbi:hypothetical protein DPMN_156981 [Dreissena polymorpha]|uniref:Uncharacterized protein n=1 Tax=Dreissena polymorpha TaxID=45954 RepID=A0A9D4FU57_DREPO|nr:hypothetical protein DPMN_156981 [Dreissena polymorpha]
MTNTLMLNSAYLIPKKKKCDQKSDNKSINIFNLGQDSIGTNVLTKFHEDLPIHFHFDCTKNVTSRVLTRKNACPLLKILDKTGHTDTSRSTLNVIVKTECHCVN